MSLRTRITPLLAAVSTSAAAAAIGVSGTIGVTHNDSGETTVVGIEHVHLAGLTFALVALVPLILYLGRLAERDWAPTLAVCGQPGLRHSRPSRTSAARTRRSSRPSRPGRTS